MTRNTKLLSGFGVLLLVLAACDGSDGAMGNVQSQFGAAFAAAFNEERNGDPVDTDDIVISYMGVDGPNLTADPVDF